MVLPPPGDIAFRFLKYVRFQQEKQRRRAAPPWPDAAPQRPGEEVEGPAESRAVVCDINREMLSVGRQKAERAGIHTGPLPLRALGA